MPLFHSPTIIIPVYQSQALKLQRGDTFQCGCRDQGLP